MTGNLTKHIKYKKKTALTGACSERDSWANTRMKAPMAQLSGATTTEGSNTPTRLRP